MSVRQVRVLTLNEGENRETTLYRLQKGWNLRFILGSSLQTAPVRLFCNHPSNKNVNFDRKKFEELLFKSVTSTKTDRHDFYADVSLNRAGSFNYYFTVDTSAEHSHANGLGYFLVDPSLHVGPNSEEITLDCLQCQTVVTKLLGPFPEWEERLMVTKESGYNIIHFTPLQELGVSNSAYSIRDQRRLSPTYGEKYTFKDIDSLVQKMNLEWEVLSLTDLVYNHTAIDSPWLQEHPECAFNLENSPHLRPAYIMDRALLEFSDQVSVGEWKTRGIVPNIEDEEQLQHIRNVLQDEVLPAQKLHEFWCVDVECCVKEFKHHIEGNTIATTREETLVIKQDPKFRRLRSTVDMNTALQMYNTDQSSDSNVSPSLLRRASPGVFTRQERIKKCCDLFKEKLLELNAVKESEMLDHIKTAAKNYIANGRWRFLANDGPMLPKVTKDHPIMHEYFVWPRSHNGGVRVAERMWDIESRYVMAVNGWVMGDNPLKSFADEGSYVYLRRELIEWGDSVKLRYGNKPDDCPYLWDHMEEYTTVTAKIFPGIRLDNCHSTPIHVAEYMLDIARRMRPDLYVVAELFTGAEHIDNIFINRLGISSLIRESMSAWDAHEQGRLIHRYGGIPVGSFVQPRVRPLVPNVAHALFYDQTHDNPSPVQKRSPFDLWPSSALVSMACCASGSNRGYDQLVPHHIHIVKEDRLYTSWTTQESPDRKYINSKFGMTAGKKVLNQLHFEMGKHGFNQVYVDQLDANVVSVTRHNSQTHESIVLVARTSFQHPGNPTETGQIRPITIQGIIEEVILQGRLREAKGFKYVKDDKFINGLPEYYLELKTHIPVEQSDMVVITNFERTVQIAFVDFTPGSVIAFRTNVPKESRNAILEIRRGVGQFGYLMRSYSGNTMFDVTSDKSNFRDIVGVLSLQDLNTVLYRAHPEEEADGYAMGAYDIPGYGLIVYCGIRGLISVMNDLRPTNDLGHPLCENLRNGPWLPDYVINRLLVHEGTIELAHWFEGIFGHLKNVPPYLVPCYFDAIITGAYVVLREMAMQLQSDFVKDGTTFVQALAMGSIQFCSFVRDSKLPHLSKKHTPAVRTENDVKSGEVLVAPLSLAAGFPHFCSGYMRNWGRDTFISIRGLLLITGRFEDARILILAYAGCLRHGLIPNLLNEGVGARYNSRDAVWWWLQCIQEYCKMAPDGYKLLSDMVKRMYPTDDSVAQIKNATEQPLQAVMQEALQRHAEGIKFVERNAGPDIDRHMQEAGFTVEAGIQWDTGFVYGGSEFNCGTWMDKMGTSYKAGNRGKPATPRDGSAIELVGLCMSAVSWLNTMNKDGKYPYTTVKAQKNGESVDISFQEWADLIKTNFEKCYWITPRPDWDDPEAHLIARYGMYKDSYKATNAWPDYQLRPNFAIAMVVAPQLFSLKNAWDALELAQEILLGPLGMKTLDPRDWAYRGYYDNASDGDEKAALGFSYHQGPEWVWPLGFFLRAKLKFASMLEKTKPGMLQKTIKFVQSSLSRHYKELMESPWQSLPELTNADGSFCPFSCRAQAWSISCLMDVLFYLEQLDKTG